MCVMKADIEKTQVFYCNFPKEYIYDCAYCRNYRAKIRDAYPEMAQYLATLGVDIEKTFEMSPLEIGEVKFEISDCYPGTGINEEHLVLDIYPIKLKFEI